MGRADDEAALGQRPAGAISARNLADENFASQVEALLAHRGVAAGLLEVEVTESVVMIEPERAARLLNELHALGIRIAIDDFGAGYASLAKRRGRSIVTADAMATLTDFDFDIGQGYHLCRPVLPETLMVWYEKHPVRPDHAYSSRPSTKAQPSGFAALRARYVSRATAESLRRASCQSRSSARVSAERGAPSRGSRAIVFE